MAHLDADVVSGLRILSAGRQQGLQAKDGRKPLCRVAADRDVARRELDVHRVGTDVLCDTHVREADRAGQERMLVGTHLHDGTRHHRLGDLSLDGHGERLFVHQGDVRHRREGNY